MTLCDHCIDPGLCCRLISLSADPQVLTRLEALAWIASVQPASHEIGLPFIPEERQRHDDGREPFERWHWSCIYLTTEGRCSNYEGRPNLCRTFMAGIDQPCAMNCPKELSTYDIAYRPKPVYSET